MSQRIRWLAAIGATGAVLGVSIWISGAYLLPLWLKSGSDRWVIASSIGVALAGLTALWGANFAQSGNRSDDEISETGERIESPLRLEIHMKAKSHGNSRIYQAGGDQTIKDDDHSKLRESGAAVTTTTLSAPTCPHRHRCR
jgi:hypothetical protein